MSQHGLGVWTCPRLNCGCVNLAAETHCGNCHDPKPAPSSFRQAIDAYRIRPVDLEEFCRANVECRAVTQIVNGDAFLTLQPPHGQAAIWSIDGNDATPRDQTGRASW